MRGREERRQLGENQMNVGGSGDRQKDCGISCLILLLIAWVTYFHWGLGLEPQEYKHSVGLLWQEKVLIVLQDRGEEDTEYYISATGWRDSCKHLCWTAFNIMQWPCHCRLHQPLEQIICLIHETGLCWDYSAAVKGIKWQSNRWSHPFSSSYASPL